MKIINISNRLKQVASFVRYDSIVADIGTDHAYLPIWLMQNDICNNIIASDINFGPCQRARENVESYILGDKIEIIQTDGLHRIEQYSPDDIIIAGMGGELIWDIISVSDYVKNTNVRLILQPMTKVATLRELLITNGFYIIDETLAEEDRRIYEIMYVKYNLSNTVQEYNEVDLLIGKCNINNRNVLLKNHIEKKLYSLEEKTIGMKSSGLDIEAQEKLINELRCLL